jgi:glycosyltransferase involved in cell wall biosynthesis
VVTNRISFFCAVVALFYSLYTVGTLQEKKLFIVITSFNNADWCIKNLESIFMQKNPDNTGFYENYTVVIVDDESFDGNAEYIERYIYACNQQHRVTLIKNKTRQRSLANIYMASQLCDDPNAIIFNIDGDDYLAHDQVFSLINEIYHQPKEVWITYGQFINWPTNEMGYCQPVSDEVVEKQLFRKKWWKPGQLRTFYAWLFQQVHLKDLLFDGPYFQGKFFPANSDLALYYPMMEQAGFHYQFIPDIIYIRNVATPLNDFKVNKEVQVLGSKLIREKKVYPRLESACPEYFEQFKNKKASIFLFSQNPECAQKFITSVQRLMLGIDTIYVCYLQSEKSGEFATMLSKDYSIRLIELQSATIKDQLIATLNECPTEYLIVANDHTAIIGYIHCSEHILALEKAFAYAFYYNLSLQHHSSCNNGRIEPLPPLNYIKDSVYAWGFQYADAYDWRSYNTINGALYRAKDIAEQWQQLDATTLPAFIDQWQKFPIDLENIGLCCQQSKIGLAQ